MARDRRLLWVISYHHACNDGTLMVLVAVLPILIREMDLSYSEVGVLGLGLIITVVVQYFVGKASDKHFSRYLLEVGAGLMALSFVLIPLVSDFTGLFIVVIAMRVGASFYHPIGVSWITREYQGPYLDTSLGIQSGVVGVGQTDVGDHGAEEVHPRVQQGRQRLQRRVDERQLAAHAAGDVHVHVRALLRQRPPQLPEPEGPPAGAAVRERQRGGWCYRHPQ